MKRKVFFFFIILFVLLQAIRPERNTAPVNALQPNNISTVLVVPDRVADVLKTACYDCHSNATHHPFYAHLQPLGWWLQSHIEEGKKDLNFDEFATYKPTRQYNLLEEIGGEVKRGKMPLPAYVWMHREAKLSAEQKYLLINWVRTARQAMEVKHGAATLADDRW